MNIHTLEFSNDRLNAGTAAQCSLDVVLGADGVSILSADASGEVLTLQSWLFSGAENAAFEQLEWEMRGLLQQPVFSLPFAAVHCALFHRNATLVPRRLFQHGALPGYFKLLLRPSEYVYAYDELSEFDACLVYATEPGHAKLCAEFFPQARVRHLAVPLLRAARQLMTGDEPRIFVNFRNQVAQIAVFERQNLLFYNAFPFSASTDLLYYVLLIYDQFRLNPRDIPLTVAGNLLEDSELYRLLYRFVRDIRFAEIPGPYHLPPGPQGVPAHCHFDLYCLKNM